MSGTLAVNIESLGFAWKTENNAFEGSTEVWGVDCNTLGMGQSPESVPREERTQEVKCVIPLPSTDCADAASIFVDVVRSEGRRVEVRRRHGRPSAKNVARGGRQR